MSDILRERVARAVCLADKTAPDPDAPILIGMKPAKAWVARLPIADAAIAETKAVEMREALEWAEDLLRHLRQPTIETINCVTHLQALLAQLDREDRAEKLREQTKNNRQSSYT